MQEADNEFIKVAIIGSRSFKNKPLLEETMQIFQATHNAIGLIISGGAKGADSMGVQWANRNNIPTIVFYPDFKKRKRAYHFRNRQIVKECDVLIAFWNGRSTGTKYTIDFAKVMEKEVVVVKF